MAHFAHRAARLVSAAVAGITGALLLLPAAAFAHGGAVAEVVRRRPRFGAGLGLLGLLCCLVVVGAVVVLVVLLTRRRRPGR